MENSNEIPNFGELIVGNGLIDANTISPDSTLDSTDNGDDTLRRFRYQITYSCIVSLYLLSEESLIHSVYCEHYEDVLVKLANGRYSGLQIKTRDLELGAFECNNDAITSSILRFVELEKKFPGQFDWYTIVSNVGFSRVNKSTDLNRIIELVKKGTSSDLSNSRTNIYKWIKKLATAADCTTIFVQNTLKKCKLQTASSLVDIRKDLIHRLQAIEGLRDLTYGKLATLADKLVGIHFNASSLLVDETATFILAGSDAAEVELKESILQSKKITKGIIERAIEEVRSSPVTLFLKDSKQINELPSGYTILEKKMDAGGISKDNIDLFKDNKFSFEALMASWLHKNSSEADKKYNQVRLVVQNEASAVYDEKLSSQEDLFGTSMLIDLRRNLRERYSADRAEFFDCKLEHLYGVTGTLTEDCTLWWSPKFDL